jgi:hypothetical protein
VKSASTSLRRVLLSPSFSEFFSDNGSVDIMDEDAISNLSIRVKLQLTVWDFILPATPSLPAVFGVSSPCFKLNFWEVKLRVFFEIYIASFLLIK